MTYLELEEVDRCVQEMSTLIHFFALPYPKQLSILPRLPSKRCYDFSDGDLTTDQALLALACFYNDYLNRLSLRLLVAEMENPEIDELYSGIYWAIDIMSNYDYYFENPEEALEYSGWSVVRQLSRSLGQILAIDQVNQEVTERSLWRYLDEGVEVRKQK